MKFHLPDIEIRAQAGSRYTRATIQDRLAAIESRSDAEARRERAYLLGLLHKAKE